MKFCRTFVFFKEMQDYIALVIWKFENTWIFGNLKLNFRNLKLELLQIWNASRPRYDGMYNGKVEFRDGGLWPRQALRPRARRKKMNMTPYTETATPSSSKSVIPRKFSANDFNTTVVLCWVHHIFFFSRVPPHLENNNNGYSTQLPDILWNSSVMLSPCRYILPGTDGKLIT